MASITLEEAYGDAPTASKSITLEEAYGDAPPAASPPAATPAPTPIKAAPSPSTEDASGFGLPFMGELPAPGDFTPPPPPAPPAAVAPPPPAPPAAVAPPIAGGVPLPRARPVEFGPPIPPREEEGPPASAAPPLPPMSFNEVMRRKMAGEPTPPEWDQPLTQNGEPVAAQALRGIAKTGEFGKGLSGAIYGGNAQMFGNATEALGILAGSEKIEKLGGDLAKHGKEQGDQYKPRVPGFENIRRDSFGNFISDAFAFAGYSAGQAVGTSAPSISAGSAAAVLTANPFIGLAMGALGPSYIQNWGDVYGSAKENKGIATRIEKGELSKKDLAGLTAIAAVPIAALDVVGLETMLGRGAFVVAKQGLKNRVMAWMANRAIAAGTEGTTEGLQEVLSQWAQHDVGGDQTLKKAAFSVINNALGGMFGGGLTSAAVSVGEQNRNAPGAKIGDALDQMVEGAKFKTPASAAAAHAFSPNPDTAGAPGDFPNQPLTDRPTGPPPAGPAATPPAPPAGPAPPAADAAASQAGPATSETDVAAEKTAEPSEAAHPPASPRDAAILKSYGYDDADIAEMPPEQRAEEVKAALDSGIGEPEGTSRNTPIDLSGPEALKRADELVDEDHTHAQAEGRNRPLVHATWGGLPLSIEARGGGTRKMQVPETGEPVTQRVGATYGYWKGTKGGDGQEVDVAVGPHLSGNSTVYVIDENGKNGKFRQVKTFIGFASPDDAVSAYLGNGKGVDSIGSMVAVSSENFRKWIKKGGRGRGERLPKAWGNKVLNLQDLDQYKVAMSQSENPVVPQLRGEGDSAGSRVGVGLSGVQGAFGDAGPSTEGMGTGSNRQREGLLPRQPSLGEQGGPSGQYEKSGTSEAGRQDNVRAGVGSGNRFAPVDDNAPSEKRGESERGPVFEQKGRSSHGVTKPAAGFAGAPVGEQVAPQQAGEGLAPPSPANAPKTADEAQRALWDAKYEAQKIKRDLDRIESAIESPRKGKNSLDQLRLDELRKRQEGIARSLRKKYAEALDAVDDAREAVKRAPASATANKPEKPNLANRPSEPTRSGVTAAPSPEELDIPTFLKRNKANVEALDEPTIAAAQDIAAADPAEAIERAYVNELKSSGLVTDDEIKEHLGDAAIEPARTHEPSAPSEESRGEPAEAGGEQGNQVGEHGGTAGENQPSGEESVGGGDRAEGKPEAGENATGGEGRPVAGKKQAKAELRARVVAWVGDGKSVIDIRETLKSEGVSKSDLARASNMAEHYVKQKEAVSFKKPVGQLRPDKRAAKPNAGPNKQPSPAKPQKQWKPIGKNHEGAELYEDERGVRSILKGDIRYTEPVAMRPTREGVKAEVRDRRDEYLTEGEYAAANPPAEENKTGVEKQIVDMYLASTGDRLNQRVPISGIRYRLPQISRSDMDAALERMHLTEGMTLSGDDNPSKLATSIRNGGLKFKGVDLYYLWITKLPDGMQAETKPSAQQGKARDEHGLDIPDGYTVGPAERVKDKNEARTKGGEWTAVAERESPWGAERGYGDTAIAAQRNALDRAIGIVYRLKMPQSDLEVWVVKNTDGKRYNVVMRDTDAGKTLPVISIFNSLGAATAGADEIRRKSLPSSIHDWTEQERKEYIDDILGQLSRGEIEQGVARAKLDRFDTVTEDDIRRALEKAKPAEKTKDGPEKSVDEKLVAAMRELVQRRETITHKALQVAAEEATGRKLSEGVYDRKDIYDALETAVNQEIAHDPALHLGIYSGWKPTFHSIESILKMLPTQTVRSEEQQQFQQFSTPPTYSMAVAYAANIQDGDVVLEPSAGTGSLVAATTHPGATIYANELSPRRAALLRSLADVKKVFTENAEQLNNVLPDDVKPTVVVMNPPFSQTAGRMRDKKDLMAGANHIRQAYKRLQPGGRLVAIVGRGMTPGSARYASFWNEIPKDGTLVANIGVDGKVYSKYGTSFGTRLLVIDKIKYEADFKATTGDVDTVDALMSMLEPIRDARPAIEPKPAEQAGETLAPTSEPVGGPGQPVPSNAGAVGSGRGSKRGLAEPGPGGAGIAGGAASGLEPGQRDVVAPVEPQRTGQAGAGQEPDIRPATGEKPEGGSAQGAERDIQPATGGQSSAPTSGVNPVEKLVVEQAKPGSQTASEITDSLYEAYQPRKLKIQGAKGHPGPLVESAAMASVDPPSVNYSPSLPKTVVKNGLLSLPQLEAVVYAGQAHGDLLPAAEDTEPVRKGFFIGDGTGPQPFDAKILTPRGWKTMGDIQVGDTVVAVDGTATKVLGVFPKGEKEVYRIRFTDGAATEACADHLWSTTDKRQRNYKRRGDGTAKYWDPKILSTSQIAGRLRWAHDVPVMQSAEFVASPLPIDPYLVGALLGDGCIREGGSTQIVAADPRMLSLVVQRLPVGIEAKKVATRDYHYNLVKIGGRAAPRKESELLGGLRVLGIIGLRAWEKHVPSQILFNGPDERLACLRGLMDTDGYVDKRSITVFTSTSEQLARDVVFLVRSLGGVARITQKDTTHRTAFNITVNLPVCPFLMPAKAGRWRPHEKYPPRRYFESIEPIGRKAVQCILIDHPSHLYVTDDFVVTHNTGKGREISGIILDNWQQGRTKAIWVSEKKKLLNDARRDWGGLGQDPKTIFDMGNVKSGESITAAKGIAFVTYDTLKGGLSDQAAIARGGFVRGQEVKIISGVPLKDDLTDRAGSNAIVTGKGVKSGSSIVYPIKFSDGATAKVAGSILEPVGEAKTVKSRVDQIVEWVGKDFDGVIAFDEAHNMGNALAMKGDRGVQDASQKALSGVALQAALPKARVVYVSATGATEVYNLAYADRLGLWGRGTSFADKTNFINEVQGGGIAAMEIVARDMKQLGVYMARNLSYDDGTPNGRVEYDRLEHKLSSDQREIYDTCAEAWHVVLQNIEAALEATGGKENKRARTAALSAFWGTHQRFFNQVITSLQMPSVIKAVEADLAAGRQAVLQLTNTNEASQERAVAKVQSEEELEDLDITPRDQLIQLVEKSFPTQQFETYVDENGNERTRAVLDSAGKPVQNAEAVEMRDALIERISSIRVPQGPLDMILDHFGADVVAEVTGRKRRFIFKEDDKGNRKRMEDSRPGSANENETNAFQAGKKKVLVFSEAGGTGASYHADNTAASKGARRSHYLVQAGWRADKAVQGFGRTHRTNQASAPIFHLVTTDLDGQKRFISSIARRLAQLGALTKGQRQAGDQGIFSASDNLESDEARLALRQFLGDLAANRVEGLDVDTFEKQTGLSLRQKTEDGGILGVKVDNIDITQFLNRLLSLKIDTQNRTFAEFSKRLDGIIEYRAAAGLLDSGLETVRAGKIEKKNETTVYTDEKTGAETKHVELQLSDKLVPLDFRSAAKGKDFVKWVKSPKGRVYAVQNAASVMSADTGSITPQYRLVGPISSRLAPQAAIEGWRSEWTQISPAEAEGMWGNEVAAAPEFTTRRMHLITGAILPIWDRLKGSTRVVRLNTTEGERMIGRVIPNSAIGDTLKALGANAAQSGVTPQEVYNRVMAGGSAVLANGWRLSRRLVAGQHRIELTGPASWSEGQQVKSDGVFTERIGYTTRYFVPADEERGPKVIAKLIEFRPVSGISGGESEVASLGGYDINQAERNIELKRLYSQERILMSRYVERPSEELVREFEALSERIAALEGKSRDAVYSQQAIKAAGKWTEARKAQIAADVTGIVRRVVGHNVQINTPETHRISNLKGWGDSNGSVEVAGAMRLSEALLTVSIGPRFANANQTAYHEAYHAIEGLLQTDQERALMERETPQLRQYLRDFAKTGALAGITANEVDHLAGYEVRAIMFELYGNSTDKFSGGSAIRRFFLKVHYIAQRFMRVLRMRGFRGWEDVFEAAYYGEFARREARPSSERTLGSDTPEAAARRRGMTPARARAAPGLQVTHERIKEALNDPTLTATQRLQQAMGAATLPISRAMWDRIIDLYRFQKAAEVANGGAKTPAGLDAHLAATLFTGRTGSRFKEFKRLRIDPILDAMAERGISMDDMNSYLYARHAQERNAAIAAIDPTNLEGSGMSDTDAATILNDFAASGMTADLDAVASMVDTVLLDNRNMLVAAGLEDPNTIAAWTNAYQNYVPLKGSEMGDDEWGTPYAGKGYSINGPESMRALGRHSRAGDIMANVFDQSMRSIVRAEKNRVALAFYRFAKANPSPWYKMGLAERRRHIDPLTGLVAWQTVTTDRNADSAFSVKIGGKAHYVQIMHPGLLAALKDLGGEQMNGFFRATAKFTRMYSSLQTAKNPEFVLTNLLRDLADAGLNMTAEQQRGFKRAFAKNILSGKSLLAAFLGETRDASGTGSVAKAIEAKAPGFIRYYDEWQAHGGKISMYGLKDIQSLADELRRDIRRANEGIGKRALMALPRAPGSLIKLFEGISDITESMTRLAVYAAAREAGLSPPVAAKAAREMTVDFNAKGQYGRYINALYAFAGPSIIGPTRLVRRLARSKTMRRAAMGVAGLGLLATLWNLWAAPKDDEDKKNRYARMKYWEREKNFVVFIPGWKDGLKVPMGYGVAPFWMIGEEAAMVLMGETPWLEAAGNVIGTLASTFNPLGAEGSAFSLRFWASMATPTILDPVMQLLRNRNWLDRPIHPDRDRFPQGSGLANSEIAKATTSPYAIDVAKWLNRNSGGGVFSAIDSKYQGTPFAARPGALDFYPDDLEFAWNFALGGLGKFVLQNFDMFKDIRDGVDTPVERTPFIRRFAVPGESEGLRASEYYDSAHKVSEAAASYRASLKSHDPSAKGLRDDLKKGLKPYIGERGGQKFLAEDVFAGSNETLKRLRKNEEAVKRNEKLTPEGRAAAIQDIRKRRLEIMRRTNRLYESRYGD